MTADVPNDPVWLRRREAGVEIRVRLTPRSSRNRVLGLYGDRLKISLMAPPVGGAANDALQIFLGKALKVAPSTVRIVQGMREPSKTLLIETDHPARFAQHVANTLGGLVDNDPGRS